MKYFEAAKVTLDFRTLSIGLAEKNNLKEMDIDLLSRIHQRGSMTIKGIIESIKEDGNFFPNSKINVMKVEFTKKINKFEKLGLITRTQDKEDKRKRNITLTKKAIKIVTVMLEANYG